MKIIPNAFGERPVLTLMSGAVIRVAERWRSIRLTGLERGQIAAVRQELDAEYEAADTTSSASRRARSLAEIPSSSRV